MIVLPQCNLAMSVLAKYFPVLYRNEKGRLTFQPCVTQVCQLENNISISILVTNATIRL